MDELVRIRYVTDQATPSESVLVRAWAAADPANAKALDALRATWEALATPPATTYDVKRGWHRLRAVVERPARTGAAGLTLHCGIATHHAMPTPTIVGVGERFATVYGVDGLRPGRLIGLLCAACAVGAIIGPMLFGGHRAMRRANVRTDVREVATANGQRASLELADGTRVLLGVHSTLRTPRHFRDGARDVELDGEAYFDVRHDAAHPFRVHVRGAVLEDLGTQFGVRAYAGDAGVRVVVSEGKVAVAAADAGSATGSVPPPSVTVMPGQLAQLIPGMVPAVHPVDPQMYLAWTDGRLVFDGAPLDEALAEIGRWYDLDVRLADHRLGSRHVTGSFKDEPVTDVLQVIAGAVGLRYERRGSVVTFSSPRLN